MRAEISQISGLGRREPGSDEVLCAGSLLKSSTSGGMKEMSQMKKVALTLAHGLFQAVACGIMCLIAYIHLSLFLGS